MEAQRQPRRRWDRVNLDGRDWDRGVGILQLDRHPARRRQARAMKLVYVLQFCFFFSVGAMSAHHHESESQCQGYLSMSLRELSQVEVRS